MIGRNGYIDMFQESIKQEQIRSLLTISIVFNPFLLVSQGIHGVCISGKIYLIYR